MNEEAKTEIRRHITMMAEAIAADGNTREKTNWHIDQIMEYITNVIDQL